MTQKNLLLFVAVCASFLTSCCPHTGPSNCSAEQAVMEQHKGNGHGNGAPQSQFIPVDSANKMLASYLNSVNAQKSDSALHCIIVDADQLRAYLNDSCNGHVTHVKLMFAHTLDYINSGHGNQYAGYKSGALTLIVAGYDNTNNYVMASGNSLLDYGQGCPSYCPASGSAANDIIVYNSGKK